MTTEGDPALRQDSAYWIEQMDRRARAPWKKLRAAVALYPGRRIGRRDFRRLAVSCCRESLESPRNMETLVHNWYASHRWWLALLVPWHRWSVQCILRALDEQDAWQRDPDGYWAEHG